MKDLLYPVVADNMTVITAASSGEAALFKDF
jgi:hypothetical protein